VEGLPEVSAELLRELAEGHGLHLHLLLLFLLLAAGVCRQKGVSRTPAPLSQQAASQAGSYHRWWVAAHSRRGGRRWRWRCTKVVLLRAAHVADLAPAPVTPYICYDCVERRPGGPSLLYRLQVPNPQTRRTTGLFLTQK
jgi:hypothetical protein